MALLFYRANTKAARGLSKLPVMVILSKDGDSRANEEEMSGECIQRQH